MPYAVNIQKGNIIYNEDIGELPGDIAVPITKEQVNIARHLRGVIVFSKVAGREFSNDFKTVHGEVYKEPVKTEPIRTYKDFVKTTKSVPEASRRWEEYKKKHNIK